MQLPQRRRAFVAGAACVTLLVALGGPAMAEQWWSTPNTAGSGQVQADVQSLHCDAGLCEVTQRTLPAPDDAQGARPRIAKTQYDCVRLSARPVQGEDGQGWRKVEADSVAEALLTFACTFGSRPPDVVAAGRLNADGREFVRVDRADGPATPPRAARPVRQAVREPSSAPSPSPQPGPREPDGRAYSLQLASSPDRAGAQAVIDRLSRNAGLAPGETFAVETAAVAGRAVFRVVIDGVEGGEEARRLCASAKAAGYGCLVRSRR